MNAETFAVIGIVIALFSICVAVLTVRRTKTQILEMSDIKKWERKSAYFGGNTRAYGSPCLFDQ